jgi:CHASE3 domain sensor protein
MENGDYVIPAAGTPERDELDKFAMGEPASAEDSPETADEPATPETQTPETSTPPEKVETVPDKQTPDVEAELQEQRRLLAEKEEQIRTLSRTSSNSGRKLAELQKELDEAKKKLDASTEAIDELPELPDYPDPDDEKYADEGGSLSDAYQKDMREYNLSMRKYNVSRDKELKRLREVEKTVKELSPRLNEANEFIKSRHEQEEQEAQRIVVSGFNDATTDIQNLLGLKTAVPWTEINTYALQASNGTPEEKTAANQWLAKLSKEDTENFNKLANIALKNRDASGQPILKAKTKALPAWLEDMGYKVSTPTIAPKVDLEKLHSQHHKAGESGIDPSIMGGDENLNANLTDEEKTSRLNKLSDMASNSPDPKSFARSKEGIEYEALKRELGYD